MSGEEKEVRDLLESCSDVTGANVIDGRPHLRSMVSRLYFPHVRALIAEIDRLRRYERAMQSMADQICSPKTTAEDMVRQILGEHREKGKGCR